MAILKTKELRQKSNDELQELLSGYRAELRRLKAQVSAGVRPENPGKVRELKRTVARILTILQEKKG